MKPQTPTNALKSLAITATVVFVLIPLMYCLLLAPFLDASRTALLNMHKLPVLVTNLDGASPIGAGLLQYVQGAVAAGSPLPGYSILVNPGNMTDADIRTAVREGSVWAAVFVTRGASAALQAAVANASAGGTPSYNAADAIKFVYDEGRSPLVAPTRIVAPTRQLLLNFIPTFAASWTASLAASPGGSSLTAALARTSPSLLTSPVRYSEESLFPSSKLTVTSNALTVGCILVAVLSLGIAKLSTRLLPMAGDATVDDASVPVNPGVVATRSVAMLLGGGMLGVCYAVLVMGIGSQTGSVMTGGGNMWAQMAAAQWLSACCFTFFLAGVIACVGQDNVSTVFLFVAYGNALAGWNLDLADEGYVFFQYAPLYHVVRLLRYIMFGSLSGEVGSRVGALVAWAVISVTWYLAALYGSAYFRARVATRAASAGAPTKDTAPHGVAAAEPRADAADASPAATATVITDTPQNGSADDSVTQTPASATSKHDETAASEAEQAEAVSAVTASADVADPQLVVIVTP